MHWACLSSLRKKKTRKTAGIFAISKSGTTGQGTGPVGSWHDRWSLQGAATICNLLQLLFQPAIIPACPIWISIMALTMSFWHSLGHWIASSRVYDRDTGGSSAHKPCCALQLFRGFPDSLTLNRNGVGKSLHHLYQVTVLAEEHWPQLPGQRSEREKRATEGHPLPCLVGSADEAAALCNLCYWKQLTDLIIPVWTPDQPPDGKDDRTLQSFCHS